MKNKTDNHNQPLKFSPMAFMGVLGTLVVLALVIPLALYALPYIEFFNDMAVQPKGKTQGLYGRTHNEDRIVGRIPVAGTIARGYEPYPFFGKEEEIALLAGEKLINPLQPTMENLRYGQKIYDRFCFTCHGRWGDGDGPVVGPDRFPAPPSLHAENAQKYIDGRIYHVIIRGQGKMPAYDQQIPPEDRWPVVNYVRVLQQKRKMELSNKDK